MFEDGGMGMEEYEWILRDEYVHYMELARALGDPTDWPAFRLDLLRAINAAFNLGHPATVRNGLNAPQQRAAEHLELVRVDHDPALNWCAFSDAVWAGRGSIKSNPMWVPTRL
jgi:hypothetical protein